MKFRMEETRAKRLDFDAMSPVFQLQCPGKTNQEAFGGGVHDIAHHGRESGNGGNVDDRACLALDHARQGGMYSGA